MYMLDVCALVLYQIHSSALVNALASRVTSVCSQCYW